MGWPRLTSWAGRRLSLKLLACCVRPYFPSMLALALILLSVPLAAAGGLWLGRRALVLAGVFADSPTVALILQPLLDQTALPFPGCDRWLVAGPARSGASWHVDPSATSAWNTLLSGKMSREQSQNLRLHWLVWVAQFLPGAGPTHRLPCGAQALGTVNSHLNWASPRVTHLLPGACPSCCRAQALGAVPTWACASGR